MKRREKEGVAGRALAGGGLASHCWRERRGVTVGLWSCMFCRWLVWRLGKWSVLTNERGKMRALECVGAL